MVGQYMPIVSMSHQYLVTESIAELEGAQGEAAAAARSRCQLLSAAGARAGCCSGPMSGRRRPTGSTAFPRIRLSALSRRSGAAGDLHRRRHQARADPRHGRRAEGDQRADPLFARRQSLYRPGPWPAELLPMLLLQLRHRAIRRRRQDAWRNGSPMASRNGISGSSIRGATPTTRPRSTSSAKAIELYQNEYAIGFPAEERPAGPAGEDHARSTTG